MKTCSVYREIVASQLSEEEIAKTLALRKEIETEGGAE